MMRILHLISSCGSGGAEVFVRDLAIEQKMRGHDVSVGYLSSAADQGSDLAFEAAFQARLDAAGVGYFELGHGTRRNPLRGAGSLLRILARTRPHVVHAHLATALVFRLLCPRPGHTVYTHHTGVNTFPPVLYRLFDLVVDRYVAICESCENAVRPHTKRPVVRIYNGIDARRIRNPGPRTLGSEVAVLSVGSLVPAKSHTTMIEAVALIEPELRELDRRVRFLIAGEGAERTRLEALIQHHALGERISLLGARTDVADLMASAQLLLSTSVREGFPISFIEALHAGLPILCTNVGGCSELVENDVSGFVVPPSQPEAVAERLLRLLTEPGLLERFSQQAHSRASKFTVEHAADAYLETYGSLVSS